MYLSTTVLYEYGSSCSTYLISRGGVLLGILGGGVPPGSPNPDTDFRPKNVTFHTRFQTRPLKSIPVFRPCYWAEIMLSLLRLERKQENSSNPFRIRIFSFLFYSFGIETINTFIHSRSSLENYTRFQTKMGKVQTRFQTKTAQKTLPDGAAHTYIAYVREYPPGLDFNRFIDYISAGMRECRLKAHYSLNHCGTMRAVD